jgi:methionyl-tRNA formyltransferase
MFSLIDDWDIGPLIDHSGHEVAAWVRPVWGPRRDASVYRRGLKRLLKVLLSKDGPLSTVPPKHNVREWIERQRIPTIACQDVNSPAFCDRVRAMDADLFVVAAFPTIFKATLLGIPKKGVINYHPSLLPRYAGAQPGFWVLRNGEAETGITVHRMTERIDAGEILAQEAVRIGRAENLGCLMQRLHHQAAALIIQVVDEIAAGRASPRVSSSAERSYFRRRAASDLMVNWHDSADSLVNLLRAIQPFEPLKSRIRGKTLDIFSADAEAVEAVGVPGEIVRKAGRRVTVQTGHGLLHITCSEIEPLHGWLNALAQRVMLRCGDRFDLVEASSETDAKAGIVPGR